MMPTPQMALSLSHSDKASFENYWVSDNRELVSALKSSVAMDEQKVLYLYGPQGAGKSHLLFALMRFAKEKSVRTSYLSLNDEHVSTQMLDMIQVGHVVCIDDIHAWAGDENRERALFTLFEQVKHAGGQLVISAIHPPESSGFVIKDLVSRLSSGLIYALHELKDEQKVEAIQMRAMHRGLSISGDTVKYLVNHSSRDNQDLFAILDQLDKASLVEKRRITIPFLQTLFKAEMDKA